MEFTKDIYFNDNLENEKTATITYSGELFKNGSEYVNLVFGFGENWDYTTTLPMQKTENGFTAEVEMKDYNVFNFCFSNEHNCWDNNNSCNYISPILPKVIEQTEETIDFGTDYSTSIDDIIEDILGNTVQNNIVSEKESESVDKILESISQETLPEIEELFTELFSAEYDHPKDEIQETPSVVSNDVNAELIRLFNELFESNVEPIQEIAQEEKIEDNISAASFNLDGLVSDLLDPVISQPVSYELDEEISLFDDIKEHEDDEETSLTVIDSKDLLVSSRKLSSFYKFKKKIKIACYKLLKLPKYIASQFGFGED